MQAVASSGQGVSPDEFRAVLGNALEELAADERAAPLLRAAGLSLRLEVTDLDVTVTVRAGDDAPAGLTWSFDDDDPVRLALWMDSETANGYLQGSQSLAIGIARGRVRCSGESRVALAFLPLMRFVAEPYRREVHAHHPELILA